MKARQKLFDAEQNRASGRIDPAAIRQYCQALADWRQVLLRYRDFSSSDRPEEDSYETQLNLIFMLEKSPEIQKRAKDTMTAVQALVPTAVDDNTVTPYSFTKDVAREIAERESNIRIACFDPQVQLRVNALLGQPDDDAALRKDWPEIPRWKRVIAAEAFARAAKTPPTPAERDKAAEDPTWRKKAFELLLEAGTKPTATWAALTEARDEIARHVVEKEFDWLPEYRESFKDEDNRWVSTASKQSVRMRLNLARPKVSTASAETPPPGTR